MQICFGLFAIRRSETTNNAMFDPDVCGALVDGELRRLLELLCESEGKCSSTPQTRFKGPKVVRFKVPSKQPFCLWQKKKAHCFMTYRTVRIVAELRLRKSTARFARCSAVSHGTKTIRNRFCLFAGYSPLGRSATSSS